MQTQTATELNVPGFDQSIAADVFTVTPSAASKMAELFKEVDDEDLQAIRVFVAGGGCSGMSYGMTFTDQKHDTDLVYQGEGFAIYVDAVAMSFLEGVEIDFVDRGPAGASFVFNNAFQSSGGGGCSSCGSSGGGCS
ncbi:MAG: iron-sulfur cluster assembly accessory protein [Chromatiales bacterium]|nr:iron-sulfur cluster assembly accessory protein [Chromatiales bacterium]